MNKKVQLQDLGRKDYKDTWDYQEELFAAIVAQKVAKRERPELETDNHFLFVEHPHVYTLGKSGDLSNLLLAKNNWRKKGRHFIKLTEAAILPITDPVKLSVIRF